MVKNATCRATHGRYLIFTASDSELRFIFGNSPESLEMSTQRSRISSKFLGDTLPKVHSFINTDSIKICSFDYIIDEDNNIVLYWLDQVASNILKRVNIKTSQDFENIKDHGFNASSTISVFIHKLANDSTIKTLAVDWINSKVYLLENDMIRVVNDGKEEKSIIDAGPHSADLVVDPETRQMFWSTMLRLIYVASMDGNGKRKLVHENIEYASGLAIDYPAKRLYWCDFRKSTIETVNFDGHDRQLVRKFENLDEFGLKISPFKMDIFEDEMFVVFSNRSILKLNKFGYQHHDEIFENGPYQNEASHIKIVHAFKRKYSNNNPCVKNPCDKSAICLLSSTEPLKRSCLCADSMYMQKNGSYVKCLNFSDVPKMCTRKCNEGKCRYNSNNEQFCECPPKFEGPFCDQYICSGFCLNQGICQIPSEKVHSAVTSKELKEQRICRCTKNYTGDRCQIPSHMCVSSEKNVYKKNYLVIILFVLEGVSQRRDLFFFLAT